MEEQQEINANEIKGSLPDISLFDHPKILVCSLKYRYHQLICEKHQKLDIWQFASNIEKNIIQF